MTRPKRPAIRILLLAMAALALPALHAEEQPVVNSAMNGQLLYEVLVGEISADNGDVAASFQLILDAARKSHEPQLFERAIDIALRAHAGDSALEAAQAWYRITPSSPAATRYLLQILVGLNRLPETVKPLRQALTNPSAEERLIVVRQVPRIFARAADKVAAAATVERALADALTDPETSAAAYVAVASMRLLAGDAPGTLQAAGKSAELDPLAPEPALLALELMGPEPGPAEALVLASLEHKLHADVAMGLVRKLLDLQRFEDARSWAEKLTQAQPELADAWLVRGSLALQNKKVALAETSLHKFLELQQAKAAPAGTEEEASRASGQAYLMLAQIAAQRKAWDEAQQDLNQVDDPDAALRVVAQRADILARQGKLAQARELIRNAPEAQPEDARVKLALEAELLRDQQQFQAVYRLLQDDLPAYAQDPDYVYDLAMAADKLGKEAEAEQLLRRVMVLKPDYYHAYNALGYALADRKVRLSEARELIAHALQYAPNDPYVIDSMGWVEFRSGNVEQAARLLQAAFHNRPDPEIAAHLGEVFWTLKQTQQAKAVWQEGLDMAPDNETLNDTLRRLNKP